MGREGIGTCVKYPGIDTGVKDMADKKDDIILSIRNMSKSFGRNRVLDHINLDLRKGTVMGLMGENGAGARVKIRPS